jgi:hypothetical protein
MATEIKKSGQSVTDRFPTGHLASGLSLYPTTNSLKRLPVIPTVRDAMASPDRRRRAVQLTQSA